MNIFDLLFLVLFLTSVVTLIAAAASRSAKLARIWMVFFLVYMGIVVVAAVATPRRVMNLGEAHCFDDWCIAVQQAGHIGTSYTVTYQVSSRARRVSQREKGIHVFLTDSRHRRFDPVSDIPFDVLLQPGEAITTERSFIVPAGAQDLAAVVSHEGSYCFPGCFIIGEEGHPLHKPTIVPLP